MSQRKLILAMQMTLDGFVEGPNGEMDWLIGSDDVWNEMFKDLESVDTYLLGRKMYPGYAGFWQSMLNNTSADPNLVKYARLADKSQHIVFTKGDFKPDWKNTRVAHDLPGEVARLKKQDGKNIVSWGGATFASSLINLGLVDEYRVTLNPTLLAGGKSMFNNLEKISKLKLIDARPTQSGLVILRYQS
jgi:dihydrofolate reductase